MSSKWILERRGKKNRVSGCIIRTENILTRQYPYTTIRRNPKKEIEETDRQKKWRDGRSGADKV